MPGSGVSILWGGGGCSGTGWGDRCRVVLVSAGGVGAVP